MIAFGMSATVDWVRMTEEWLKSNPESLPQWLTPEELLRLDEIGTRIDPTDPPPVPVRNIAEFEPMEGVLIRYPLGIPLSMVASMSQYTKVVTIVSSQNVQNQAINSYNTNGVNMANCEFIIAPTDSYWTRDYGPLFIFNGNNELGVVNFSYNRPRPSDDNIPVVYAVQNDLPLYGMNIQHTGGNYMSDGHGTAASTQIVYTENSSMTPQTVDQYVENFLGITNHLVVQDPNGTYINHIDCWGKFLAPDKVLIRSVPTTHSQYQQIENTANYFACQTSPYGTPYRVYRVYTPNNQPYSNALILNDRVYVPQVSSTWDSAALTSYEEAMPGYQIIGVYSSSWVSTDAVHCRTKELADRGMLYIRHLPLLDEQPLNIEYQIDAFIYPYSGEELYADSLKVYYRINSGDFQSIPLTATANFEFSASITEFAAGDTISYYIYAADQSGRRSKHPFIGAPDPHRFIVSFEGEPPYIIHDPYTEVYLNDLPLMMEVEVTDPAGISSVQLESRINGGDSQYQQFNFYGGNTYMVDFGYGLSVGDFVEYRIIATNEAVPPHTTYSPIGGWYSFTLGIRQVAEPYFIPEQGIYEEEILVDIECDTEDISIFFTIDDTIPDQDSQLYTEPILISETTTIRAIGYRTSYLPSEVVSAHYIIESSSIEIIPIASDYKLHPAYPNPFNPSVNISFSIPIEGFVTLDIYNIQGKKIRTVVEDHFFQGDYNFTWNGKDNNEREVSAGVYFYRMKTEKFEETRKMILLK